MAISGNQWQSSGNYLPPDIEMAISGNQWQSSGTYLPPVARRKQIGGHEREAQRASEGMAEDVPDDDGGIRMQ